MTNYSILAGNNIATVIGALELGRAGEEVMLFTDGKRLGGHFGGVEFDGHAFDIGMVTIEMVEPKFFDQDLATYSADIRNDWTRFADKSNAWLEANANIERAPTTYCLVKGQEVPDYLLTNRLDGLPQFGITPPGELTADDQRHAKYKILSETYDTLDYGIAGEACHGADFHQNYIEPFVKKLAGKSSSELIARFHRGIWAPLYYPETLSAAMKGDEVGLPEYPFWSTSEGRVSAMVQACVDEIQQMENVTIVTELVQELTVTSTGAAINAGCVSTESGKVALGLVPSRMAELLSLQTPPEIDSLPLTVLFALVRSDLLADRPACIMIADEDYAAYRYTDQDAFANRKADWHRVVLEASAETIAERYPSLSAEEAMMKELELVIAGPSNVSDVSEGIEILRCITSRNALTIPTKKSIDRLDEMAGQFSAASRNAILTGGLLGYGVTSLNDQVVQGLKIANQFLRKADAA